MVTGRLKSNSSKDAFALDVKMSFLESSFRCFWLFVCYLLNCISKKHANRRMTLVLQRDLHSKCSATQKKKT